MPGKLPVVSLRERVPEGGVRIGATQVGTPERDAAIGGGRL